MAVMRFLELRCIKHTEVGGDEPYLEVGLNKVGMNLVWSSEDMKSGQTADLRNVRPIAFQDKIYLSLHEKDSLSDDLFGTGTITTSDLNRGQLEMNFQEKKAHYQLVYEITNG
jgi:hypothetical protein